jgi:hypothetical protein
LRSLIKPLEIKKDYKDLLKYLFIYFNYYILDLSEIVEDNENDIGELMREILHKKGPQQDYGPFVSRPVFNQPQRASASNLVSGINGFSASYFDGSFGIIFFFMIYI